MRKNVASQVIGAQIITAADGSVFTGSVTCYVCGDGGSQAAGSVGSGACTHEGNGFHTYAPAQAETNYDHVAFTFTGTGAIAATVQIYTIQHDPAVVAEITAARMGALTDWIDGGRLDLIADAILTDTGTTIPGTITTMQGNVTDILEDTGTTLDTLIKDIPTVAEFEARTIVSADYTVVSDLGTVQTGDAFARLGAPAGASVSADIAAVKVDTAAVLEDTGTTLDGKLNTIDGIVDDILVDTGTTIPGTITTMQGNVTDILADTNELQADWTDGGRLDLIADAILADTNELQTDDIPGTLAALNDIAADDVWDASSTVLSLSWETIVDRLYRHSMNDMIITDATGAVALRNEANDADIANWGVTDDDTDTTRTDVVWV